jgi:hypothetical protein
LPLFFQIVDGQTKMAARAVLAGGILFEEMDLRLIARAYQMTAMLARVLGGGSSVSPNRSP